MLILTLAMSTPRAVGLDAHLDVVVDDALDGDQNFHRAGSCQNHGGSIERSCYFSRRRHPAADVRLHPAAGAPGPLSQDVGGGARGAGRQRIVADELHFGGLDAEQVPAARLADVDHRALALRRTELVGAGDPARLDLGVARIAAARVGSHAVGGRAGLDDLARCRAGGDRDDGRSDQSSHVFPNRDAGCSRRIVISAQQHDSIGESPLKCVAAVCACARVLSVTSHRLRAPMIRATLPG